MATLELQGVLATAQEKATKNVVMERGGKWTGHISMERGAQLQVPLPPRYTEMSEDEIVGAITRAREVLGDRLVILGHHYQREEVIRWADFRGDSFKLCKDAAAKPEASSSSSAASISWPKARTF
jgi:quinolinate synthase